MSAHTLCIAITQSLWGIFPISLVRVEYTAISGNKFGFFLRGGELFTWLKFILYFIFTLSFPPSAAVLLLLLWWFGQPHSYFEICGCSRCLILKRCNECIFSFFLLCGLICFLKEFGDNFKIFKFTISIIMRK